MEMTMNTTTPVDFSATSNPTREARHSAVIVPINTDGSVAPVQPGNDQTLVPSMPDSVPTLDDFSFMMPAPETIHVYYSERSRPLFGILRVPDENGMMRRQAIAFGRRGGKERWHLVPEDDAYEIVRKATGGGIPLYRLDKLTSQPDAPVICMLDEYAADIVQAALPDHVVVAVRAKTCIEPLLARDVTIWPNAGEAGINEAMDVAADIKKRKYMTGECGGQVSGIDLPDSLPDWWNPGVSNPADLGIDIVSLVRRPVPPEHAFRPFTIMPDGYKMKKTGLVFIGEDGVDKQVTLTPFDVVAETDLAETGQAGLILRWQNRGQQVEHVVQRGQISARGSTLPKDLRDKKMLFPESTLKLLLDFLGTVEARRFVRTVSTVGWDSVAGWDRPRFVMPGGELIGGSGTAEIRFAAPNVNTEKERLKYAASGTLQDWQDHVAAQCAGNSRLILGICLALTSPLLKVLGNVIEAGGVHIWGDAGLGKSTYSNVVTSVWGDPSKLMIEIDGTKTGFENAAELASCIGLFLEELKNDDKGINKEIGRIIYMWANRKGGLRSGPNIALRETKEFDIMFCSTGEHHLKTVIDTSGGTYTGGIEARMTSIKAEVDGSPFGLLDTIHDALSSESFVDQMKADCESYHGTAGRHFVAHLIEDISEKGRADIRDWFNRSIEVFTKEYVPEGADRAINRVAKRFAVFAAVGELARAYGTLPWDEGEAFAGVGACFRAWIDDRGGMGSREEINAVQQVRKFISMHRFTRFEDIVAARTVPGTEYYQPIVKDRVGYREIVRTRDGDDAYAYYITPEGWDEICKGIDPRRAAKAVLAAGALQPPQQGRGLTIQKRLPREGKIRVYVITPEIMTAGGPIEDDQDGE
jgi:uncharacterized protein (DUF927 family)